MKALLMAVVTATLISSASAIDVEQYVLGNPTVKQVQVLMQEDTVVVAILSEPIFLRSERVKYVEEFERLISEKYGIAEVIVTLDLDLFHNIKSVRSANGDSERIEQIIKTARQRRQFMK